MSGTYEVLMGDRGRLVMPHALRQSAGLTPGDRLTLIDAGHGIVMFSHTQLRDVVRADLDGIDLVTDLLAERRSSAAAEDVV